jgi:hypothetical protein
LFVTAARMIGKGSELAGQFPERPCPVDVPHLAFPGPF